MLEDCQTARPHSVDGKVVDTKRAMPKVVCPRKYFYKNSFYNIKPFTFFGTFMFIKIYFHFVDSSYVFIVTILYLTVNFVC